MKLLIICLRRSGSTIFWNTLNQDARLTCFDEPFNPMYAELPRTFYKPEANAVKKLWTQAPSVFWKHYTPIAWWEELDPHLTERQESYLEFLFNKNEHVAIDVTRCQFKIRHILERFSDVKIIYLYRDPKAFVTSHILPNRSELPLTKRLRNKAQLEQKKKKFWTMSTGFNDWHMESIIGGKGGLFDMQYNQNKIDFIHATAVEKLLVYWTVVDDAMHREIRNEPNQILGLSFEGFCNDPESIMTAVYKWSGLDCPSLNTSRIHTASDGFNASDEKWRDVFRKLEIKNAN